MTGGVGQYRRQHRAIAKMQMPVIGSFDG